MTKAQWEDEQDRQRAEELCGSYQHIYYKLIDLQKEAVDYLGKEAGDIVKGLCDTKADVKHRVRGLGGEIRDER